MEASASTPVDIAEEFDCDLYSASAPVMRECFESHPYLVSSFRYFCRVLVLPLPMVSDLPCLQRPPPSSRDVSAS